MQNQTRYCCEMCGNVPANPELTTFEKDEEIDPNPWDGRVDLTSLTFGVDYIITQYP